MKVYIDLVVLLNIWLDFIIILSVSLILKRNVSLKRILLSSVFGSLSTFLLFFNISKIVLIILKLIICIFMMIISFKFKNLKYCIENIIYFYMVSIILAGFIYLLKDKIIINNFLDNFIFLIVISPIIIWVYCKKVKKVNNHYNSLYNVDLYYQNKKYTFTAFLDTGNKLYDQYKRRPIILLYTTDIKFDYTKGILVPYETASGKGVLKCLEADKIIINGNIEKKRVIFGVVKETFNIEDVNMILHNDLIGG